jgi:hypothetical protein
MDLDTRELLRKTLRPVLVERSDRRLAARLDELGWDDVVADDPTTAICTLFEIKGEVLGGGDALGPLLARRVAEAARVPEAVDATVVLDGYALGPLAATVLVPGADGRVALAASSTFEAEAVQPIDEHSEVFRVRGSLQDPTWLGVDAWEEAVAAGRWALGAELTGIAQQVIADAVAYTTVRHQYGRPIGSFQALQHRLANAHVSMLGARRVVSEAAGTGSPWTALVAKALAGAAAEEACTHAQQCYGAIGFSWEHTFHRYLRRTYLLDRLLGNWRELEVEIGRRLLADRTVPKLGGIA